MVKDINTLSWPLARLGEGLEELAGHAGLAKAQTRPLPATQTLEPEDMIDIGRWIEWLAERMAVEAESIETTVPEFSCCLHNLGPAVLKLHHADDSPYILVLKFSRGSLQILAPDLTIQRCAVETLRTAICEPYEAPVYAEIEQLLSLAAVPTAQWPKIKSIMCRERLGTQKLAGIWILRLPPSSSFWQQLAHEGISQRLLLMLAVFSILYGLEILAWTWIGQAALNGRLDMGWLSAWVLLVMSLVPLQAYSGWLDGNFALDLGRILKKRLLAGALRLDMEAVKHQGAGQLLGRVMESQALESLALNGGFSVLIGVIELLFSGWVLAIGAAGSLHVLLLAIWLLAAMALIVRYIAKMQNWTLMRLDMTHKLIERMVGHKTCLAQEPAIRRNIQEDQAANAYLNTSKLSDQAIAPLAGGLSRGWMIIALAGLAPAFINGGASSAALAISLGGILLANRALSGISTGITSLSRAALAWKQVSALFHSADKQPGAEPFLTTAEIGGIGKHAATGKLIAANDIVFRYRPEGEAILRNLDLAIYRGDRILLEGASGGGKSTLAALLVGLQIPDSGLLLLNGLDSYTLGQNWHRLAAEAPQFHENHILSGTLAFNLLMGRNWPASAADMQEAEDLCVALGLGELLERMPSGLLQRVGETGWQLSHGERSRIFLARALLQKTQLTILDESFAALDPESLQKCLQCAFKHARTLLVIAHP